MSSFKRKVKNAEESPTVSDANLHGSVKISGVKAWVSTGMGIVSSGSRQLDEIIGGGIPLGSTMLYLTDMFSNHAAALVAYQCAESLSHRHCTAVIASEEAINSLRTILPTNRNVDPGPESSAPSSSGNALTIAWQYEKYLSK